MLAVAGAGKTYYICNSIVPEKKNLILAYTHENIRNINRELIEIHGSVPTLTSVMTFSSFVYRFLVCPYEPTILRFFKSERCSTKGIVTIEPPKQRLKDSRGNNYPNPKYVKKSEFGHYITENGCYYCSNMSELIMTVKEEKISLIKKAAKGLNMFFEQVMIDEFQDFREHDYNLVIALAKEMNNILLVGDYYQHSVSAVNNSGKPFKKGKDEVSYDEFKELLIKNRLLVDEETLKVSRRCSQAVCEYVNCKLGIKIDSRNDRKGQVIWVEDNIEDILEDDSIIKLVYKNANSYNFKAVNWSYSKGDTMENVCVILTEKLSDIDSDEFKLKSITTATINKLYVAMTRTKGDLYLIKCDLFNEVKEKYS